MQQISIIQDSQIKNTKYNSHNQTKLSEKRTLKRPQQINILRISNPINNWRQCKIIGKNINIRSYSACCQLQKRQIVIIKVFFNRMYIYGGYRMFNGSLNDFYSIDLDINLPRFQWKQVQTLSSINPGKRSKHSLLQLQGIIYLIGGLHNDLHSSNDIYTFSKSRWIKQQAKSHQLLPNIDSFATVVIQKYKKIIILGGYNQKQTYHSNQVYQYNCQNNQIKILFQSSNNEINSSKLFFLRYFLDIPVGRSGCTATAINNNYIYLFGGKTNQQRLNDLWLFDLSCNNYIRIISKSTFPISRNGHSLTYNNDKLYLFGGIHDVTWQLDDLHIFDLKKNQWVMLEQYSPRKIQKKIIPTFKQKSKDNSAKNISALFRTLTNRSPKKMLNSHNSTLTKMKLTNEQEQINFGNPGKMIDQQRKKAFLQRKKSMLKIFQISKQEKSKMIKMQTSSQAMLNTINMLNDPISNQTNIQFEKKTKSTFLQPLQNYQNLINGKKPCARDGHCALIIDNQLIIFGGDRHQMSFNDIYKLNLNTMNII